MTVNSSIQAINTGVSLNYKHHQGPQIRIYLTEMKNYLQYKTKKSCREWCRRMMVTLFTDPGTTRRFAIRSQFEDAYLHFVKLQAHNTQVVGVQVNIDKKGVRAIMDDPMVRPLNISPSKKWKTLTVFCYKCKTDVSDYCLESNKPLSKCPFADRHRFKVYVTLPKSGGARKTKTLDTRDVNEAIKEAIEFERQVKEGVVGTQARNTKPHLSLNSSTKPLETDSVASAIREYILWLRNEGVPSFMQRNRSEEYVKDIERKLNFLIVGLKEKGHDPAQLRLEQIDAKVVGDIFDYFQESAKFGSRTYNKHFSYFSSFLNWFSEEHYKVRNWFDKVTRKEVISKPESINKQEVEALLPIITEKNGIQKYETGVKAERNFYRPYLRNAFRLALETGRRREELINMKWKDITDDPDGGFIEVEDRKVNNIENRTSQEDKKYNYVPLTESLRQLINELNYQKMRGFDKYILAPEIKDKRNKVMADLLSRSFSHFYKQLNTGRELTFKSFRKRYITSMAIYMRGSEIASNLIGHTNTQTTKGYYLDPKELAKALNGFQVFTCETERQEALEQVRKNDTNNKSNEIEK